MKISIYSTIFILILALATSCQKEELEPVSLETTEDQQALQQTGTDEPEAYIISTVSTSSMWYLCGEYVKTATFSQPGGQFLTIYGNGNILPPTRFKQTDVSQLPIAVLKGMDNMGLNMQPDIVWHSFVPTNKFVLLEYVNSNGFTEIHLFDTDGNHLCKGFHQ